MFNNNFIPQIYFKTTGYSFTHMGRLFLRMFVGIMLAQFGIRQLMGDDFGIITEMMPFVASNLSLWLIIVVELVCPFLFMIGFFTRISILPPFALMIVSCVKICMTFKLGSFEAAQMLCAPFLFMGIFVFLLLVGPGKISVDYFYSLYLIGRHKGKEEDLEEV